MSDRLNGSALSYLSMALAQTDGDNEGIVVSDGDDETVFYWTIASAFLDLFAESSLGGIIVGQPPKVIDNNGGSEEKDNACYAEA